MGKISAHQFELNHWCDPDFCFISVLCVIWTTWFRCSRGNNTIWEHCYYCTL